MAEPGQSTPEEEQGESFAELFEQSGEFLKAGDVVEGTILRVDPDNVLIDVG